MPRRRVALCALALCVGAPLAIPQGAQAVVDDTPQGGETVSCPLNVYNVNLQATLAVVGVPVANSSLQVDAGGARLVADKILTGGRECQTLLFQIPQFQWSVTQTPPGQTATLANANTLAPTVNVTGAGLYRVSFTACPNKCTLKRAGKTKTVGPSSRAVDITVNTAAPPPPEYAPSVPQLSPANPPLPSHSYSTRKFRCSNGGGFKDPEWVTTEQFRGPQDYKLVEGPTTWSRTADLDNFLNHDSEDFEWKVAPDPPYTGLSEAVERGEVKSEWESNALPRLFYPTRAPGDPSIQPGDRTSSFGFWIFDCGHDPFKTEIHPPVGVAVQRPRPVQIPSSFRPAGFPSGLGSNIWVPGITTDIWFNRNSGENGRCGRTALHQPATSGLFIGDCIRQPYPLNRKFTFNLYIPRDPQLKAQELGRQVPPVPLFINTEKLSSATGGPDPVVTRKNVGGVTTLEVTVDLTNFRDKTYGRRLSVAWAYPQTNNWGASRWRVRLNSMKVYDDQEPPFDDGDWRFDFNTNNRDQEWTQLFSCDGCVDDDTNYILNVSTGKTGGKGNDPQRPRNMGADPVVFPGQTILVHTSGYDDEILADNAGSVVDRVPQLSANYSTAADNTGYRLNYSISAVGSVGVANLTPQATSLMQQYAGTQGVQCGNTTAFAAASPGTEAQRVCTPGAADPTFGGKKVVRLEGLQDFESEGAERSEFALTGISSSRLRSEFNSLKSGDRKQLLGEVNQELRNAQKGLQGDFNELLMTFDKALSDKNLSRAVPRGVVKAIQRNMASK